MCAGWLGPQFKYSVFNKGWRWERTRDACRIASVVIQTRMHLGLLQEILLPCTWVFWKGNFLGLLPHSYKKRSVAGPRRNCIILPSFWTFLILSGVTLDFMSSCAEQKHTIIEACSINERLVRVVWKELSQPHMPGWASYTNSSQQFWIRHCGAKSLAFGIPLPVLRVCLLSSKPPFVRWQWVCWQGETGKDQVKRGNSSKVGK